MGTGGAAVATSSFHIQGGSATTFTGDTTNGLYITSSNYNVGIGTQDPTEKLTVAGSINTTLHITASGNISASGNVIAPNLIADSASFSTRVTLNDAKVTNSHQDISALALKTEISGSFFAPSASFSTRVTLNDAKVTNSDQDLSALALKTQISGSFFEPSASFSTRVTLNDAKVSGGTVGWHGSGTRIKILPKDFMPSDGGRPVMIEDDAIGSNELFLFSHSTLSMFAYIHIPTGFKATHTRIYGSDTGQNFTTYQGDIDSKTIAIKGTATAIGTEKAITNVTSDTTNYLVIHVTSDGATDEIHGGYVTIEAV